MSSISDRIRQLVGHFTDGNNSKFAALIGTSEANIRNYIGGRQPKFEVLASIAESLNVNHSWLLSGKGEMIQSEEASVFEFENKSVMHVPVVNQYAYAGYMVGFKDEEFLADLPTIPFVDDSEHHGNYLCFEVKGDSMDDGSYESYLEGDIVLCRELSKQYWNGKLHYDKWDFIIVHNTKGILLKRIIDHDVDKGIIVAHSLNDYYPDQKIKLKDVAQIFNIIDIRRKRRRR